MSHPTIKIIHYFDNSLSSVNILCHTDPAKKGLVCGPNVKSKHALTENI